MSATYGPVNLIASFGFARRWRRQCVELAALQPGDHVLDLMSGMGECFARIVAAVGQNGYLHGVDFSRQMMERAGSHARQLRERRTTNIALSETDVFQFGNDAAQSARFDAVTCSFGIKTLSTGDYEALAGLLQKVLKPGGRFSIVEISVPSNRILRFFYLFYLNRIIPLIGRLFSGNPDNYRMLGFYTMQFQNCSGLATVLKSRGMTKVREHNLFSGCATAITGRNGS
ncbi:MAG: class I SAM-dependent methyltransferase [Leptospiraceae bacterium]|nr:class I SAM-dependent methyltransferase [Leptospiraceae bacterium]MCB1319076.1 class I SAM-dependent methyltransferase [Leptospiraceae bacterium]